MRTRANVLVVEKNGDWERTSLFFRKLDGHVQETGKNLAVLAYMAKEFACPDVIIDDAGNETKRDNFKRIRNRFLGYLNDSDNYEAEGEIDVVPEVSKIHSDIDFLYLVKIERVEYGLVEIGVAFTDMPLGIGDDEFANRIMNLVNGNGTEIVLEVK